MQKDKECFGSKLEPNGQITVNIVLYGGTVLYGRTPSFQTDRTCTVLYGVLRYGTIITVKKAEVRRISTSLIIIRVLYLSVLIWDCMKFRLLNLSSNGLVAALHWLALCVVVKQDETTTTYSALLYMGYSSKRSACTRDTRVVGHHALKSNKVHIQVMANTVNTYIIYKGG